MRSPMRLAIVTVAALSLAAAGAPAGAEHGDRPHSKHIKAKGHSAHPATFFGEPDGVRHISSDIAFQGDLAYQGNYDGFRIIDIKGGQPEEINWTHCNGDQGDIVVYENILVRSWNTKKSAPRDCDGTVVPAGWEGVHIFDISDTSNPVVVGAVSLPCGSHTATAAGVDDGDLIVYSNNSSSGGCTGGDPAGDFMDIIAVPLDDPGTAALIHREPLVGPATPVATGCHDVGVILGDLNKAACASADTINVWDISDPRDPVLLYTISEPGVGQSGTGGRWHSAAFTWDGEVLAAGWEPGGGAAPECESTDSDTKKSAFFFDADTGVKLGQWVLPRPQDGAGENCTVHNFNVVPYKKKKDPYTLVLGNYQAGTWIVDFSDPSAPETYAWSDPEPITPADLGGAWSSYFYNGRIYESDITTGLNVFDPSGKLFGGTMKLDRLNPQTQEFSL